MEEQEYCRGERGASEESGKDKGSWLSEIDLNHLFTLSPNRCFKN